MSHTGSLLILPSGIHGWRPASIRDTTAEDFAAAIAEKTAIGLLLCGTGGQASPLPPAIRRLLSDAGLAFDVMDTGAAVRTYNILLAEDRPVAAALIAVD